MPFSLRKLTKLQFIAFCLMAVLGITTFGFSWFKSARNLPISQPQQQQISSEAADTKDKKSDLEVEVFKVTPQGIEPRQLNRIKGNVLVVIQNFTGRPLPNLQLVDTSDAAKGKAPLTDSKLDEKSLFHEEFIDLKEGDFVLKLGDRPEWQCSVKGKLK